ncbi:hypothetical protein RRF57_006115 [Xylaria bambusicola]|uniref:Uncharacterized protein n=1 Tax=Xylaria bambusicola TaxID=326684 RepID=A0AAN7UDS0_9PEZI
MSVNAKISREGLMISYILEWPNPTLPTDLDVLDTSAGDGQILIRCGDLVARHCGACSGNRSKSLNYGFGGREYGDEVDRICALAMKWSKQLRSAEQYNLDGAHS